MLTSAQCLQRFGNPTEEAQRLAFERKWMTLWVPPPGIAALPRKVYCHRYLLPALNAWHEHVLDAKIADQVKTWDGCFNVRTKKGATSLSLHAWGLAFDINAAWNGFGQQPTMSRELVGCGTAAGLNWGGLWAMPKTDGMHFQLVVWPDAA